MATRTRSTAPTSETETETNTEMTTTARTEPITVGPDLTPGLISAWDGLFYAFNARVERWDVTPEGLVAVNFTIDAPAAAPAPQYTANQLLHDLNVTNHAPRLFPQILYINGIDPEPFSNDKAGDQMWTSWLVQSFKGSVEGKDNASPEYARNAVKTYKASTGTPRKRGPRKSTFVFKNINDIADALGSVAGADDPEGLARLEEVLKDLRSAARSKAREAATASA